jgi:hypothetical protein
MAAKRVRLSNDGGTTYYTLPGNTANISNEAGALDDTIFGQSYHSTQPGLVGATIAANGLYKGFAGYVAKIYQVTGSATTATGLPTTLVSGKTYQVTDPTKRIWPVTQAVVVKDGGVDKTAFVQSINFLFGMVTFLSTYTVTGAVTVDTAYYATTQVAGTRTFTLTMTADSVDNSTMPSVQANTGHRTFQQGLKTVSLELGGVYALSNGFRAALEARVPLIVEINPDGSGQSIARGYFTYTRQGQSGAPGALEEETVTLALSVPTGDIVEGPFFWKHLATTTLNQAILIAEAAWESGAAIKAQYLPDGVTGVVGSAIVTEMTLTGGLEAMNAFAVTLQITGALAPVP